MKMEEIENTTEVIEDKEQNIEESNAQHVVLDKCNKELLDQLKQKEKEIEELNKKFS